MMLSQILIYHQHALYDFDVECVECLDEARETTARQSMYV